MLKRKENIRFFQLLVISMLIPLLFSIIIANSSNLNKKTETLLSSDTFSRLSSNTILVNEVYTGNPDWIEIVNIGPAQDMTGWTIHIWDSGYQSYSFPAGFVLNNEAFLQISESSGTNDDDDFYINHNLNWVAGSDGAVAITDDGGVVIDHVEFNGFPPGDRLAGTLWSGSLDSGSNDDKYRTILIDTDTASDWSSSSSSTLKALNPGQTFDIPIVEDLFSIEIIGDASIALLKIDVPSSVTTGKSLGIRCDITNQTNLKSVNALIQTPDTIIVGIITLFDDGSHNDGGPNDGIYRGTWDSSDMPLSLYYIDIIIQTPNNKGKFYENIATFSVEPPFFSKHGWLIGLIIGVAVLALEGAMLVKYRPAGITTKLKNIRQKLPKWKKMWQKPPPGLKVLTHKSGERPLNVGVSISSCPSCKKSLSASVIKKLELGYRVYCPKPGCFHPLHRS